MELIAKKYDLTEGVVWKKVVMFAMPILLGIILQSLYTTVDAIIIGRFAGKEALAAIESVYTLTKLPVNFLLESHLVQQLLSLSIMALKNWKKYQKLVIQR